MARNLSVNIGIAGSSLPKDTYLLKSRTCALESNLGAQVRQWVEPAVAAPARSVGGIPVQFPALWLPLARVSRDRSEAVGTGPTGLCTLLWHSRRLES